MLYKDFKAVMAKAKRGQHIGYHMGLLSADRLEDKELDSIARFCEALFQIDTARLWQRREGTEMAYYVTLTKRLRTRKDQSGSFQDAERLMEIV